LGNLAEKIPLGSVKSVGIGRLMSRYADSPAPTRTPAPARTRPMTNQRTRRFGRLGAGGAGSAGNSARALGDPTAPPAASSGTVCGTRHFGHVSAIGMGHLRPAR